MFSVVITTKNRLDYLRRAVISILKSSILPCEIIIINDGGVEPNLSDLNFEDINLIIENNKASKGANYSRNKGIEISASNLVFLLDDDDAVEENSFQKRINVILKNQDVGLVFTGIKIVHSSRIDEVKRVVFPLEYSDYTSALLKEGNVIGSTSRVLIRKDAFEAAGKFDESLPCMQDYDLWIRMSQVCKIKHDNSATILYTVHNSKNQISSKFMSYLKTGEILLNKYSHLVSEDDRAIYMANLYFRVALAAASTSVKRKIQFAFRSISLRPSKKALILLLIPYCILKRIYLFA